MRDPTPSLAVVDQVSEFSYEVCRQDKFSWHVFLLAKSGVVPHFETAREYRYQGTGLEAFTGRIKQGTLEFDLASLGNSPADYAQGSIDRDLLG